MCLLVFCIFEEMCLFGFYQWIDYLLKVNCLFIVMSYKISLYVMDISLLPDTICKSFLPFIENFLYIFYITYSHNTSLYIFSYFLPFMTYFEVIFVFR